MENNGGVTGTFGFIERFENRYMNFFAKSLTYAQVADLLEKFIDGSGHRWDLDNYLSVYDFKDPLMAHIQSRVAQLDFEFPAEKRGQYCSPEGIAVIRGYILKLRELASRAPS